MSKNTNSGIRSAFAKAMHTKSFRDWLIASSVLLALLLVALMIVIAVRPLYNGICKVAGGERRVLVSGDPGLYMRYEPDYASKEEAYVAFYVLTSLQTSFQFIKGAIHIYPIRYRYGTRNLPKRMEIKQCIHTERSSFV